MRLLRVLLCPFLYGVTIWADIANHCGEVDTTDTLAGD